VFYYNAIRRETKMSKTKAKFSTKQLVVMAMIAAMGIVLEKYLGNTGPKNFRLPSSYIAMAMSGMLYGPVPTMLVATVIDILANLGSDFNPVFVFIACFQGLLYGLTMHKKSEKVPELLQAIIAQGVVTVLIYWTANTLALYFMYGVPITPIKFLRTLVTYPLQVYTLYLLLRYRKPFEQHAQ
jgi:ECF transporter S component (folate family)